MSSTKAPLKTLTEPKLDTKGITGLNHQKPINVVLHNDEVNTATWVVRILMKVFHYDREQATAYMVEAHTTGKAVVKTTHLEYAEMYKNQLESYKLTASLEEAA